MPFVAWITPSDITDGKDAWLPTSLKYTVTDLFNKRLEVKRARVAHAIGAINQHLWLGEVFFRPVHTKAKRIALVVHSTQALTM
jgi:hypothetical protein